MGSVLLLLPALFAGSLPPATLTLLMTGDGLVAAAPTVTVKVMGAVEVLAAIALASGRTHVTTCPAAVQLFQPVPVPETNVSPVGSVSVTTTLAVLVVRSPRLVTVIVYTPFAPTVKLPLCDLLTTKSGASTKLVTEDELLPNKFTDSFGLLTLAVLVTLGAAAAATRTGNTIVVEAAPALITVARVQEIIVPPATFVVVPTAVQVHPAPTVGAAFKVKPAGKVSVTVYVPVVATAPILLTVIV